MAMLSNRPMRGIKASPPPKSWGEHSYVWQLDTRPSSSSHPHLQHLPKGDRGPVGCSIRGGWGPEGRQPLWSVSGDCEDMIAVRLAGESKQGSRHDQQGVTHWSGGGEETAENRRRSAQHASVCNTQVLTGRNSPNELPGHSGAGGGVTGAQAGLHEGQHGEQTQTEQTHHHIACSGLWDLVKGVIDLQEELMRNSLDSQNILERNGKGWQTLTRKNWKLCCALSWERNLQMLSRKCVGSSASRRLKLRIKKCFKMIYYCNCYYLLP